MKSNQEWVDEYAKLREENNMVNSISKLIDMVKAEFAAHPPAPAGMEEAVRGLDNPYPLSIVLGFLIKATEYLLNKNNYDGPDYEEMEISVKRAKEIIANLSASTPPAKDNWVKIKPHFKEECVFITRSTYTRNNEPLQYDYTIWQTKWLMGEDEAGGDAFYLALLTGDGEEWGDLNDLEADEYLILFTLPTPPTT